MPAWIARKNRVTALFIPSTGVIPLLTLILLLLPPAAPHAESDSALAIRLVDGREAGIPHAERKRMLIESFHWHYPDPVDKNDNRRFEAVRDLSRLALLVKDGTEVPLFIRCMENDPYFFLRVACADVLGGLGIQAARAPLRKALVREESIQVRLALARALLNLGAGDAPEVFNALGDILERKGDEDWLLENLGPEVWRDGYITQYRSRQGQRERLIQGLRTEAAMLLTRAEPGRADSILKNYRKDENPEVARSARGVQYP